MEHGWFLLVWSNSRKKNTKIKQFFIGIKEKENLENDGPKKIWNKKIFCLLGMWADQLFIFQILIRIGIQHGS